MIKIFIINYFYYLIFILNKFLKNKIYKINIIIELGMGIGDWGLGIGDWEIGRAHV